MEFAILAVVFLAFMGVFILPSIRKEEQSHITNIIRGVFFLLLIVAVCSVTFDTDVTYDNVDTIQMPLVSIEEPASHDKNIAYSYINYMDDVVTASAPSGSYSISYIENWDSPHVEVLLYKKEKSFFFLGKHFGSTFTTYHTEYVFYVRPNSPKTL